MSFSDAVRSGLRRGLDWRGRSSRSEYWWFALANLLFEFAWLALGLMLKTADLRLVGDLIAVVVLVAAIWMFFCGLAVTVRRFHDSGRSAWWLLSSFVPIANLIVLLLFLFAESDPGPNRYGPPPGGPTPGPPGGGPPYTGSPYGRTLTGAGSPAATPYGNPVHGAPPVFGAPSAAPAPPAYGAQAAAPAYGAPPAAPPLDAPPAYGAAPPAYGAPPAPPAYGAPPPPPAYGAPPAPPAYGAPPPPPA